MVYGLLYHRSAAETSQPQKKQDKDIKNQKDREKKEKEAIKKFKVRLDFFFFLQSIYVELNTNQLLRFTLLDHEDYKDFFFSDLLFPQITGPLQAIHQVKAKADCKGGKNELSIKKGESIDIIRITDNPEGKWLGRGQDGSCKSSHYKEFDNRNWSLITSHEYFVKTSLRKDTYVLISLYFSRIC